MAVIDASVLANALVDGGDDGVAARAALRAQVHLAAPDLADVETVHVLRKSWLAGAISDETFERALTDLRSMPFDRVPTVDLLPRAFELRHSVSAYDAMYVALAEGLDQVLVTGDRRLAAANGPTCTFEVVRP